MFVSELIRVRALQRSDWSRLADARMKFISRSWPETRRTTGADSNSGQLDGGAGAVLPYFTLNPSTSLSGTDGVETCRPFWIITPPSLLTNPGDVPFAVPGSNVAEPYLARVASRPPTVGASWIHSAEAPGPA